jgi:hypothetical protein
MLGEKIYSADYIEQSTVNCEAFSSGMYWLEIKNDKQMQRIKFIKQ